MVQPLKSCPIPRSDACLTLWTSTPILTTRFPSFFQPHHPRLIACCPSVQVPNVTKDPKAFYSVFGKAFEKNSRWLIQQPAPALGDDSTPEEQVRAFYSHWFASEGGQRRKVEEKKRLFSCCIWIMTLDHLVSRQQQVFNSFFFFCSPIGRYNSGSWREFGYFVEHDPESAEDR